MRVLNAIWQWLRKIFFPVSTPSKIGEEEFRFMVVDDIPDILPDKMIFILNEGYLDESLSFKCPCGCNEHIHLNLLKDSSPLWNYEIVDEEITISPSVWRTIGCKSHFFIRKNLIIWCH